MHLADDSQFSNDDRMSRQQTTSVDCNVNNEIGTETRKDECYSAPGASPRSVSYPAFYSSLCRRPWGQPNLL
jgi:hypothetical protein